MLSFALFGRQLTNRILNSETCGLCLEEQRLVYKMCFFLTLFPPQSMLISSLHNQFSYNVLYINSSMIALWKESIIFSCMKFIISNVSNFISLVTYQEIFFLIIFCYCAEHSSASASHGLRGKMYFLWIFFHPDFPLKLLHLWTLFLTHLTG